MNNLKIIKNLEINTLTQPCKLRRSTQLNCVNCNSCKCNYKDKKCDKCGTSDFYYGKRMK